MVVQKIDNLRQQMTDDEFEAFVALPENVDKRFEYIDGEMIEVPSNPYSSEVAVLIAAALVVFIRPKGLGRVTGENGGYMVAGAKMAPDVAYLSKARQDKLAHSGYNPIAPDLVVEVVFPTDEKADLEKKLIKYAEAGVLVWVFYPERREVDVHAPSKTKVTIGMDGILDGGDVLPGFTLAIKDIFEE